MKDVEFPAMRNEVARALAALADPAYQWRAWVGQSFEKPGAYQDLTMVVNVLYDDTQVLPDPTQRVGTVLVAGAEVDALAVLSAPLTAVIDRLGEVSDADYLEAVEWPHVVRYAGIALACMVRRSGLSKT